MHQPSHRQVGARITKLKLPLPWHDSYTAAEVGSMPESQGRRHMLVMARDMRPRL